ncbi:MAG: glycosyltransferase family 2 protein [Treponema sp.]|nr:glycosyltransferase family 2 protein [Treponema sp.]MCL2271281.1 glycosyltransferase family 2 protein [Treponema sp.]
MKKIISIIIPTLNEENRIETSLKSIRAQAINHDEVEILVIDGGSKDKTREIAIKYKAIIINNPKVVPEEAKIIGLLNCTGKYVIFMDADEEYVDNNQLYRRIKLFEENSNVKITIVNSLITPKGFPDLTRYVNSFGDPFSYFIYKFDGENIISSLDKKKYKYDKIGDYGRIYYLKNDKISPIVDGGTSMFDFEYIKKNINYNIHDKNFISIKSEIILNITGCFGIIENDRINHYTSVSFKNYLKKLKFRVISNLNPNENISGYAERAKINIILNLKKYLYVLYCIFPLIVLFDSIIISFRKKCITFMLHFIFVYYVFFNIIFFSLLKLFNIKFSNINYGK